MQAVREFDTHLRMYRAEDSRLQDMGFHDEDDLFRSLLTDDPSFFKHCDPDVIEVIHLIEIDYGQRF